MAWLTIPALIGPVIGPPVGGFITTYFSWRWIFWINVPIGVLGIVLVTRYIPNCARRSLARSTSLGFVLSGLGLPGLVTGFETIGRGIVPALGVAALLAAGAVCIALYVRPRAAERPRDRPAAAALRDLPRGRRRRLPVPGRHRRHAVPAAA